MNDPMQAARQRLAAAHAAERQRLDTESAHQREIAAAEAEIRALESEAARAAHAQRHAQNAAIISAYEADCRAMFAALDKLLAETQTAAEMWQTAVERYRQQQAFVFNGPTPMPPPALMFVGSLTAHWEHETGFKMPPTVGELLRHWIDKGGAGEHKRRYHLMAAMANLQREE